MALQDVSSVGPKSTISGSPSPQLFWEIANAYQRTAALQAAVELDVFTAMNARTTDYDGPDGKDRRPDDHAAVV
jgi:hypothetical protein